jgi:hypothetical protein
VQECPRCHSPQIHRSRVRSTWGTWRKLITRRLPFRCSACTWRGWGKESGPKFSDAERKLAENALAPAPPNLQRANLKKNNLPESDLRRQQTLDLKALDAAGLLKEKRK